MRSDRVGRMMTARAVAEALGISYKTVVRRIQAGELDTIQVGRSHLMLLEDARVACRRTYRRRV
jgi:excisionase family DNA binding protein